MMRDSAPRQAVISTFNTQQATGSTASNDFTRKPAALQALSLPFLPTTQDYVLSYNDLIRSATT